MWYVNNWRKIQLWREGITILNSPAEAATLILISEFQNKPTNQPTHPQNPTHFWKILF